MLFVSVPLDLIFRLGWDIRMVFMRTTTTAASVRTFHVPSSWHIGSREAIKKDFVFLDPEKFKTDFTTSQLRWPLWPAARTATAPPVGRLNLTIAHSADCLFDRDCTRAGLFPLLITSESDRLWLFPESDRPLAPGRTSS